MNKAFIFDMDGVLCDSELAWEPYEFPMLEKLLGTNITNEIDLVGASIRGVYEKARQVGSLVTEQQIADVYNEAAKEVYANVPIPEGIANLIDKLEQWEFKLGLVTQSPRSWVDRVLPRIPRSDRFEVIISIRENPQMHVKPAPDGYLEAMKVLGVDSANTIILEDSNTGIQSAKASGAYVIGLKELLPSGYQQSGADEYADTMNDVARIVEKYIQR